MVKKIARSPYPWLILGLVMVIGIISYMSTRSEYENIKTSEAVTIIMGTEKLKEVILTDQDQLIQITKADGKKVQAYWVGPLDEQLINRLNERKAEGSLEQWNGVNATPNYWGTLLSWFLPMLLIVGFFILMMSMSGGGAGGRIFNFGRSRAKVANKDTPKTTFADVAGVDEAVEELQEIKEFLEAPGKFKALGAKIPKGVLLYGPPGTGKTLLARAVAGEAGVPFYSISGSDFVEMFVGVGASRVRDLFDQAKANAPAIVFIDEIDAVGRHRGAGMGGGHDEREQTLNQLLVEMDGFDVHGGVILIAATNRPDVLDPALLRPGRFDRQIAVDSPDLKGRYKILLVHATGKPLAGDVDLQGVARRTPGFTGADLANVLNEAALLAARTNLTEITNAVLDESIDRVVAGPQKRTRVMNSKEILITAYHEAGHALVAASMPGNDPVQKISILPRGQALGYTLVLPDQDKYSQTRGQLLDQLAYMLGGRAAEELIFHDPTTGAGNDIEKATKVARAMVMQFGMTESLGAVRYGSDEREPFLGMELGQGSPISPQTAALIDSEVTKLINAAHQEAYDSLVENREILDELVRQLLEHETLDKEQVLAVFANLKLRPVRPPWTGSPTRQPSDIPPVPAPDVPEPDLDDVAPVQKGYGPLVPVGAPGQASGPGWGAGGGSGAGAWGAGGSQGTPPGPQGDGWGAGAPPWNRHGLFGQSGQSGVSGASGQHGGGASGQPGGGSPVSPGSHGAGSSGSHGSGVPGSQGVGVSGSQGVGVSGSPGSPGAPSAAGGWAAGGSGGGETGSAGPGQPGSYAPGSGGQPGTGPAGLSAPGLGSPGSGTWWPGGSSAPGSPGQPGFPGAGAGPGPGHMGPLGPGTWVDPTTPGDWPPPPAGPR